MTDSDYVYSASDGPAQLGLSRGAMPWGVTLAALAGMAAVPFFGALSDASAAGRAYLFGAAFSFACACSSRERVS